MDSDEHERDQYGTYGSRPTDKELGREWIEMLRETLAAVKEPKQKAG